MANRDGSEIQIYFSCENCGHIETTNVNEAVYNGPPICLECACEDEMCMDHCFVED